MLLLDHSHGEYVFSECIVLSWRSIEDTDALQGTCVVYSLNKSDTSEIVEVQRIEAHKSYILKCLMSPNSSCVLCLFSPR